MLLAGNVLRVGEVVRTFSDPMHLQNINVNGHQGLPRRNSRGIYAAQMLKCHDMEIAALRLIVLEEIRNQQSNNNSNNIDVNARQMIRAAMKDLEK